MKSLVVLPVHGMGETKRTYADDLRRGLRDELGTTAWSKTVFKPIYYQDVIQNNQTKVWEAMKDNADLSLKKLREFMIYAFSDAASLEHQSDRPDSAYVLAQERIRDTLIEVLDAGVSPTTPVALLPHSLGGQVLSNYIWDSQKDQGIWKHKPLQRPAAEISFLKLETLRLMVTAGCNIPLFVAGLETIAPFARPHPSFRWLNFYDKEDVLGWPLKPLSPEYASIVESDFAINSGNLLTSWNPLSHTGYWTDDDFLDPTVQALRVLL